MKITKDILSKIIKKELKRVLSEVNDPNKEIEETEDDYYEQRRLEELEGLYTDDLMALLQIIKAKVAIDYARLVGEIRKHRYLSAYKPQEIKAMLADLIMQGSIDYDNESGQWTAPLYSSRDAGFPT